MARQTTLTKEHFDKVLKTLATKSDLGHTNKRIDRVDKRLDSVTVILENTNKTLNATVANLNRTVALLTHMAEDVNTLKEDMGSLKATVESHTTSLDKILRNTELSKTETTALQNAVKRHEQWITQIADKVGIKLETET